MGLPLPLISNFIKNSFLLYILINIKTDIATNQSIGKGNRLEIINALPI
jgi:hypothetical protein